VTPRSALEERRCKGRHFRDAKRAGRTRKGMPKTVNETTVTIRGASIQLRTDLNESTVARIAQYVDRKMRELDPKGMLPQSKISLLASLTIAGELIEERERGEKNRRDIARRLEHLHEMLDEALGGELKSP
jgi:cell division protein ZapA (FtsZ GTPase activity inhibitor)